MNRYITLLLLASVPVVAMAQSHTSEFYDTICPNTQYVFHGGTTHVVNITDWDNGIGWTPEGRWGFGPHETNNGYVGDQNCVAGDCYYPGCENYCTTDTYGGVTYYYTSDWCLAMTCTETPRGPSIFPPSGNGTAAFCSVYQGGTSASNSKLTSPFYDIYDPAQTSISFQYLSESLEIVAQHHTYYSTISFQYLKEGTTQWVELWNSGGGDVSSWSTYQGSLAALPGAGRYSFCFVVSGNGYVAAIDNLSIIGVRPTEVPLEVQAADAGTTITTTETLAQPGGYDSIIYTHWYVAPEGSTDIYASRCDSVYWNRQWHYTDNSYIDSSLTTIHGCDSIVTYHYVIKHASDTHFVDTSVCDAFLWSDDGLSYTETGVYHHRDTNRQGCDSIGTLRLTVYHSTRTRTIDSACNKYIWPFNRKTYTRSNTYYDTLINAGGCKDYGRLDIIINNCAIVDFPDNVDSLRCMMLQDSSAWSIQNAWSSGGGVSNHNTPMVGDLDDDGVPEIVCFSSNGEYDNNGYIDNRILVFDGASKQIKASITMPAYVTAYDASAYGLVKLANRKGLIVVACCDMYLRAFDIQSRTPDVPVWTSDQPYSSNRQYAVTVSFADFMGNGNPCIAVCNKIFDAQTGVLLATATGGMCSGASYAHYSHRTGRILYVATAANILGDDRQELILGNEIYNVNINNYGSTDRNSLTLAKRITPPNGVVQDGHAQVADFNLDGHLDVLITNKNIAGSGGVVSMYVWDVAHNTTSAAVQIPCNMSGKSIPLIADIDGDNQLEVVIQCAASGVGNNRVRTYKYNATTNQFQLMWGFPVDEDSYSNGMTAFDFNLDGKTEMIICDQSRIRVVDGNGNTMNTFNFSEVTIMQYPVIADVDNDGHAEIVSVGSGKLNIFKSVGQPWAPARNVWNQYMYNVTCVNNDLTIPRLYYNNATALYDPNGEIVRRPYNNYLQQATQIDQYGRPYYTAADFATDTAFMTVTPDSILFTLTYANQGSNAIKDPYQITIYKDYLHGQVVRTFTLRDTLLRNQRTTRTIAIPRSSVCKATHLQYIIALNDAGHGIAQNDGLISECDTTNNTYNFTFDSPEPPSSTDSITQCDSYLWGQNSRNYYNSGIYHDTVPCRRTALAGCDSIISLYLTIHHSSMEATDTTACDQYVWHVNGRTYTENTTLTLTFTNQQGCDSICKLNVTIYPTTYQEVFEHGCNTFYWPVDRRTYDRSVVHAEHMMSQHGCDSTYTLVLRMHYTHYDTIYDTICEGDTRAFFGQQISMEGTYMYNGSTLEGCDSISTLKIVVKPKIIPDFDSMSNCETREFSLKMHPQDSNIYQQWYMYPDNGSLRGHATDSIISFQPTLTTVYRLTARYREGLRCDATKSISVTPIQPVVAGISASSECFTPTINEIRLSSTSTGADTYAWFINGQFYSLMPTFNVEAPDNSTDSLRITLIALNNHCSDTAKTVLWSLGEGLHAPNIFTPGAERNTRFRVYGQNIIDYEIFIYNRKGVLVYHSQMLDEGWDGTTAGGSKCPQGSYAYYIRYRTQVVPDATKTKVGTVLLVR